MLLVSIWNKPVDSVNQFALQVMVTEVLLLKGSVDSVDKMLLVTVECKADCVHITEKSYLSQLNSICSI